MQSLDAQIFFPRLVFGSCPDVVSGEKEFGTNIKLRQLHATCYYPRNLQSSSFWLNNRDSVMVCNPCATHLFVSPRITHHCPPKLTRYIATPVFQVFLHGTLKLSLMLGLTLTYLLDTFFLDYCDVIINCEHEHFITERTKVSIWYVNYAQVYMRRLLSFEASCCN